VRICGLTVQYSLFIRIRLAFSHRIGYVAPESSAAPSGAERERPHGRSVFGRPPGCGPCTGSVRHRSQGEIMLKTCLFGGALFAAGLHAHAATFVFHDADPSGAYESYALSKVLGGDF